ncbi:hypothetical protein LSH36_255g06015 [Paralvinella palmiformis]|uniref:RFX-type winged-helix domain-containing protein n=1 Tax=Paralvinella palmiformis TaxID=53620 RepID=A0AAD9JKH8_9ANNE|nr:hypothetical protein LSH36_255g06015 [Paralvinella palmiformis]
MPLTKMKVFQRHQKLPAVLRTGTKTEEFTEWLKEHFEERQETGLQREQMYSLFTRRCDDVNKQVECREIFGKLIAETFPLVYKRRLGGRSGMKYYYWGLDVKDTSLYLKELDKHRITPLSGSHKNTVRLRNVNSHVSNEKKNKKNPPEQLDSSNLKEITNTNKLDSNSGEKRSEMGTVNVSCDSFNSAKTKDVLEHKLIVEEPLHPSGVSSGVMGAALRVRRQGRRNVFSSEASFSAQKRKASNCTCAKDPKKKKSKVHRMSEILASPRMRSSLRQAIRASLAEANGSNGTSRLRFKPINKTYSLDAGAKNCPKSEISTLPEDTCQSCSDKLVTQASPSEQNSHLIKDTSSTSEIKTICQSSVVEIEKSKTIVTEQEAENYDSNQVESPLDNNDVPQKEPESNQFEANPRVWRFLPPLLKKLHKEKIKT